MANDDLTASPSNDDSQLTVSKSRIKKSNSSQITIRTILSHLRNMFNKETAILYCAFTLVFACLAGIILNATGSLPPFILAIATGIAALLVLIANAKVTIREETLFEIWKLGKKWLAFLLSLLTVVPLAFYTYHINSPVCDSAPDGTPIAVTNNLDEDISQWGTFCTNGNASSNLKSVGQLGNHMTALLISFNNGTGYVNVNAYRDLPAADTATNFEMNLSFYFPEVSSVQALGFSMSKWMNSQRWEWAIQWAHNEGEKWRLWDGSSWQAIGLTQQLAAKKWHKLHLKGDISHGHIHYINFSYDDITPVPLGQMFAPVTKPAPNELAVTVEMDANKQGNPSQVFIDGVSFLWN